MNVCGANFLMEKRQKRKRKKNPRLSFAEDIDEAEEELDDESSKHFFFIDLEFCSLIAYSHMVWDLFYFVTYLLFFVLTLLLDGVMYGTGIMLSKYTHTTSSLAKGFVV